MVLSRQGHARGGWMHHRCLKRSQSRPPPPPPDRTRVPPPASPGAVARARLHCANAFWVNRPNGTRGGNTIGIMRRTLGILISATVVFGAHCRGTLQELRPYTRGLLKAPTPALRKDAARAHRANLDYLRACVKRRTVAWHHAKGAYEVATAEANADYARAVGADPTGYNSPKVFN